VARIRPSPQRPRGISTADLPLVRPRRAEAMLGVSPQLWLAIPRLQLQREPFLHSDNHPALITANCESRRLALSPVRRRGHCRLAPRQLVGVSVDGLMRALRWSARHCDVQCQLAVEPDGQPDTFL
jgi:hypothetical protein